MNQFTNEIITDSEKRFTGRINLDVLIDSLINERNKAKENGYSDLEISIDEDNGIVDLYFYGNRDLTKTEKYNDERIAVLSRMLDETSKGEKREDLLKNQFQQTPIQ